MVLPALSLYLYPCQHLSTYIFADWMLFLRHIQQYQALKAIWKTATVATKLLMKWLNTILLPLRPLNGPFSKTTSLSWHQKGQPFWITGARDDGVAVASAGPYANHLHVAQTDNYASTSPLSFYRPDAIPFLPPNSIKALKAQLNTILQLQ